MFKLEEIDLESESLVDQKSAISRLVRANDVTVFAVLNLIHRITGAGITRRKDSVAISLRPDDSIKDIFLDKTGCYCIISLQRGDLPFLTSTCVYMVCVFTHQYIYIALQRVDIYVCIFRYVYMYISPYINILKHIHRHALICICECILMQAYAYIY
jgi:hypothetical protein